MAIATRFEAAEANIDEKMKKLTEAEAAVAEGEATLLPERESRQQLQNMLGSRKQLLDDARAAKQKSDSRADEAEAQAALAEQKVRQLQQDMAEKREEEKKNREEEKKARQQATDTLEETRNAH